MFPIACSYETIYADDLPQRAIAVWHYLVRRSNKAGECWPSINRIARELHMSRTTVKRALDDLEQSGWLRRQHRWRENGALTSTLYTIKK